MDCESYKTFVKKENVPEVHKSQLEQEHIRYTQKLIEDLLHSYTLLQPSQIRVLKIIHSLLYISSFRIAHTKVLVGFNNSEKLFFLKYQDIFDTIGTSKSYIEYCKNVQILLLCIYRESLNLRKIIDFCEFVYARLYFSEYLLRAAYSEEKNIKFNEDEKLWTEQVVEWVERIANRKKRNKVK
jgi:hypothetical protein